MKYVSTFEMAEKWGITPRRILNLIKSGRIPEAKFVSSRWMIPEGLEKPADGRTKSGKAEKLKDYFRFPNFEYKDPNAFNPPLTDEELTLKAVTEAFNACRFKESKMLLGDLSQKTKNRYIRITALYSGCMIAVFLCDTKRFLEDYGNLKRELVENFSHKAEMSEYIHEIDAVLGKDEYYSDTFHQKSAYPYHDSFQPRLCNLSALWLAFGNHRIIPADLTAHEINCRFLEKTDNYFDLQALHLNLACAYGEIGRKKDCRLHFRRALELAEKYEMFYAIAVMQHYYTPKMLDGALQGFSKDFKNKIATCSRDILTSHVRFTEAMQINSIYRLLTSDDYIYIPFAVQGLTNKEIAAKMHLSAGTVAKRYSEIYAQLNVKNKKELIELYRQLT